MEDEKINVRLRCATCGDDSSFIFSEDKTYVKCSRCEREYRGGKDELIEYNQELINSEIENIKYEVINDIQNKLKQTFRGNKNFKIR